MKQHVGACFFPILRVSRSGAALAGPTLTPAALQSILRLQLRLKRPPRPSRPVMLALRAWGSNYWQSVEPPPVPLAWALPSTCAASTLLGAVGRHRPVGPFSEF